jgi:peptide/nickel transport system permease protein
LGIVILLFFMLRLAPGDAASVLAGEAGGAPAEYVQQIRSQFGLDQSLASQFWVYAKSILTLDLGFSFRYNMRVADLILQRLWPTLLLMGTALVLSIVAGVVLGLIAATRVNTWRDNVISVTAVIFYATPLFWIGLMLILGFSVKLDWFPTTGMEDVVAYYEGWARVIDIAHHLVLPALTLSLFYMALYTRIMRASMLDQRDMDYVTTARAKGLTERQIAYRHVLRNALLPVVTLAGVQLGALLGGSVVVETVFAWPGLGLLAYDALFARDFNLLLGIFFLSSCMVVVVGALVDVTYTVLDPRIKLQ